MPSPIQLYEGVADRHRTLLGIAYSRQSDEAQVRLNIGSALVQRSQTELLKQLGWPESHIRVLSDAGITGTVAEVRPAWQQLLQLVDEGKVGIIAFSESSRAARNDRDFLHLVELCELNEVLILHDGQVLDPNRDDHRMLLGVRAQLDVFENRVRVHRMIRAKLALIHEGKSMHRPPRGYIAGDGKTHPILIHPDPTIQAKIRKVFAIVQEEPSIRKAVRRLRAEQFRLPNHGPTGTGTAEVDVTMGRLYDMVSSPYYAGYYPFGRTRSSRKFGRDRSGRPRARRTPQADWVLIPKHHAAYIEPDDFWRLRDRIRGNRFAVGQPAGPGPALLQGLVWCAHCGRRLTTYYAHDHGKRRGYYACSAGKDRTDSSHVQAAANLIDPHVVREVLSTISGFTTEVAEETMRRFLDAHHGHERTLHTELESAERRLRRAKQRYDELDDNYPHLKAEVFKDAEAALAAFKDTEIRLTHELAAAPRPPTTEELQHIYTLAADLPALWAAPTTTNEDRKAIIRLAVSRVTVGIVDDISGEIKIEWADGTAITQRYVRGGRLPTLEKRLVEQGLKPAEIAEVVNAAGARSRSPERDYVYDESLVRRRLSFQFRDLHVTEARRLMVDLFKKEGYGAKRITAILKERGLTNFNWRPFGRQTVLHYLLSQGCSARARTAEVTRQIGDWADSGFTAHEILQKLHDGGIRNRFARPFDLPSVHHLLERLGKGRSLASRRQFIVDLRATGLSTDQIATESNKRGLRNIRGLSYSTYGVARVLGLRGRHTANSPRSAERSRSQPAVRTVQARLTSPP